MKRIIAVTSFIVLGIFMFSMLPQRGTSSAGAQPQPQGRCPQFSGKFAFSADGQLLRDNPHPGPVAWAGYIEFLSNGEIRGSDTVNYADESPVLRDFSGTYTVERNCSVKVNFSFIVRDPRAAAAHATLYFADQGRQFRMVQTDMLRVNSGSGIKVN